MSNVVPDTDDINVAALAVAWDIVRAAEIPPKPLSGNLEALKLAEEVRQIFLTLLGSPPAKR